VPGTPEALAPLVDALAAQPPVRRLLAAREAGGQVAGAREAGAREAGAREAGAREAGAREAGTRVEVGGVFSSSAAVLVGLAASGHGRIVAVAGGAEPAEHLLLDLRALFPDLPTHWLPVAEDDLGAGPERRANLSERLVALASLDQRDDGVLVVPADVLLDELPVPAGERLVVAKGQRLDRERLLAELAAAGFDRVSLVAAPGEWSQRGDIIDIYPWAAEAPVRIELYDDEVEELRRFEVDTQRSVELLESIELHLTDGAGERRGFDELLPADTLVLLVDPARVRDRLVEVAFERKLPPKRVDATLADLRRRPGGELHAHDLDQPDADLSLRPIDPPHRPLEQTLAAWRAAGRPVCVLCDSPGEQERLLSTLAGHPLGSDAGLRVAVGRLTHGFLGAHGGPVVVHHHELIGRRAVRRGRARRVVATRALDSIAELNPGDYVVHLLHGVARYRGMQRLKREQGEEDFLLLEFAEDTRLFVPASRIDLVERFIGGDARGPKLDKLGGKTWARKKERVAAAVVDLASELLALQAARRSSQGVAFPVDDPMLSRFEHTFAYEDTPDQARTWSEVLADMAQPRSMDRLVVGDVGFGKTEIAVRAAYLAVLAGRQVAVLVPTTILAEQHHETFRHRMAEEAVRIEVLSRLRSPREVKDVVKRLAAGAVDIVIGTHRLLAADIAFRDLGLLVVDEEQRFGVVHKERLKQLRATVDVITLSATPIPRTLHMAMSGLRDISRIATPPPGRRPVVTRVTQETDETIQRAIKHELNRGGQVFVLHNRVESIGGMLERVRRLVPRARSALAHGQMGSHELQEIVERFAEGALDVLVCTTIIESGIDIPRANTIIVTDAHHFGLADMHQLRGRVGRESTQAYAFFLVPQGSVREQAERRLRAIEEFSSLDAGLPIALRDLELRGAGNLLGAEQSGHIMAVGYDMYCRLLRAAVARASGKAPEAEPGQVEVDLGLTAFLPAEYVPDEPTRMALLRRLATAGKKRAESIETELTDRFGPLPPPARALLDLFRLRRLVRLCGIASLAVDGMGGMLLGLSDRDAFEARHPFRPDELYLITPDRLRVPWPEGVLTPGQRLEYLLERFAGRPAAARAR